MRIKAQLVYVYLTLTEHFVQFICGASCQRISIYYLTCNVNVFFSVITLKLLHFSIEKLKRRPK